MTEWISKGWGIWQVNRRQWAVVYGEGFEACTGWYESRRRAKKEITHYIDRGLPRGPFPGACAYRQPRK